MNEDIDYLLKLVLIGDSGVGKTNLLSRFCNNSFDACNRNTIGVDFYSVDQVIDNHKVKVQIWDTAGQEKYRAVSNAYYKNAHGAVIVYDITKRETFENTDSWLRELQAQGDPNIKILLIGNKNDLKEERQVKEKEGQTVAEKRGFYFFETSAKNDEDHVVNQAFVKIIEDIMRGIEKEEFTVTNTDAVSIISKTSVKEEKNQSAFQNNNCC